VPIRVASKSVRVRSLLSHALGIPGFRGVMAYSLREALWLVSTGVADVLVAYPTVDKGALAELMSSDRALAQITLMVDDAAHLALLRQATPADPGGRPVRLCVDIDASLRITAPGGSEIAHLGVRRSPVHTPQDAARFARLVADTPRVRLVGAMFYEAQVAGMPDTSAAVRLVKKLSVRDLATRRAAVVDVLEEWCGPLELVNSGGTGSLKTSSSDPIVTEVTAGSGLYAPGLFDGYRGLAVRPATFFGLDVVRRPSAAHATAFGGGYIASGPPTASRQPRLVGLPGIRLTKREGAGEVQTPLEARRRARHALAQVGDRVWLRHAKAGEALERFDELHMLRGDRVVKTVPTYRGEGRNFG